MDPLQIHRIAAQCDRDFVGFQCPTARKVARRTQSHANIGQIPPAIRVLHSGGNRSQWNATLVHRAGHVVGYGHLSVHDRSVRCDIKRSIPNRGKRTFGEMAEIDGVKLRLRALDHRMRERLDDRVCLDGRTLCSNRRSEIDSGKLAARLKTSCDRPVAFTFPIDVAMQHEWRLVCNVGVKRNAAPRRLRRFHGDRQRLCAGVDVHRQRADLPLGVALREHELADRNPLEP